MSRAVLVLVVGLCLCAGCGGSKSSAPPTQGTTGASQTTTEAQEPDQDPADFFKESANQAFLGQYGRAWDSLYPSQQALVSRSKYVDCESASNEDTTTYTLDKIEVLDQYDEPVRIGGQAKDVPSKAVTLRMTVSTPELEKPVKVTRTAHAVAVNGEWRWILTPEDYRAYKAGRCPPS